MKRIILVILTASVGISILEKTLLRSNREQQAVIQSKTYSTNFKNSTTRSGYYESKVLDNILKTSINN